MYKKQHLTLPSHKDCRPREIFVSSTTNFDSVPFSCVILASFRCDSDPSRNTVACHSSVVSFLPSSYSVNNTRYEVASNSESCCVMRYQSGRVKISEGYKHAKLVVCSLQLVQWMSGMDAKALKQQKFH